MPEQDLVATIGATELDEADFQHILLSHFQAASQTSSGDVIFPGDEHKYAIRLVYKKNLLTEVKPGPNLTGEDIAALKSIIEEELRSVQDQIASEVMFSALPVNGWFRYRDVFQILPVPPDAPKAAALWVAQPFLLQFRYKRGNRGIIGQSRREAQRRKLQLILGAVLHGHIRSSWKSVRFHWVLPSTQSAASHHCQEGYVFPSLSELNQLQQFSGVNDYVTLPSVDSAKYYSPVGLEYEAGLAIPADFEILLDRFFSLGADEQDSFLRACFWLNHAHSVSMSSASSAFMALISALEALTPEEKPIGRCASCQRDIKKGSKRRLGELLDQFAPDSPKFNEARAALFYQLRSAFSHGGALSFSDRQALLFGIFPDRAEEFSLMIHAFQLVQVVLVNWLHSRSPLLIPAYKWPRPWLAESDNRK